MPLWVLVVLTTNFIIGQRADGDDFVKLVCPRRSVLLQCVGNKALLAVGAVVGHDDRTYRRQASNSSSRMTRSLLRKPTMHGQPRRPAHAVPWRSGKRWRSRRRRRQRRHSSSPSISVALPKRADEVVDSLALFQRDSAAWCRAPDHLEDDGDGTRFAVDSRRWSAGMRSPSSCARRMMNCPAFAFFGDQRCFDPKLGNSGVQLSPFHDSKQSSLLLTLVVCLYCNVFS